MTKPITVEEAEKLEEIEHGQVVIFPHKFWLNYFEIDEDTCDGEVYWESALEGFVCTKCNLYTGIK